MLIIIICLLIEKKNVNKNVKGQVQFRLGSISNAFSATESRVLSLKGNMYHFSIDYNFVDKSVILNFHKYLVIKNNLR